MRFVVVCSAWLIALALCTSAIAGDLGMAMKDLPDQFNATASGLRLPIRLHVDHCSSNTPVETCGYIVGKTMAGVASATGDRKTLRGLILIFGQGSNANDLIEAIMVAITLFEPTVDNAVRGKALSSLLDPTKLRKIEFESSARVGRTDFRAMSGRFTGLTISASRGE